MLNKWGKKLDNGKVIGVMLMGLSKDFNSINHNFLDAKLQADGFSEISSQL